MSVNCKEEILNLSRRKVIFMGNTLEQNILQLLLFPIFKVSLLVANYIFLQEINDFSLFCRPIFENSDKYD